MHGCVSSDIWWIAKDFGIRTNSVFDTQEFTKYLDNKKNSVALSALWVKYCEGFYDQNIFANKEKYQKSDWTVRPLSPMMLRYGAHDSYFLVMIAFKQIASIMERKDFSKPIPEGAVVVTTTEFDCGDLKVWFDNF